MLQSFAARSRGLSLASGFDGSESSFAGAAAKIAGVGRRGGIEFGMSLLLELLDTLLDRTGSAKFAHLG